MTDPTLTLNLDDVAATTTAEFGKLALLNYGTPWLTTLPAASAAMSAQDKQHLLQLMALKVRTLRPVIRERPCAPACVYACEQVFANIEVLPTITFGTLVQWTLHSTFRDPGPYIYQLQTGRTGNPDADDWTNVGEPAEDVFYLVDSEQRVFGKTQWTYYVVQLETSQAIYRSQPISATGALSLKDLRVYNEMLRAHSKQLVKGDGQIGFLLKRRWHGEVCTKCVDYSGDVKSTRCSDCFATKFVGGYFNPVPCVYAALGRQGSHLHQELTVRGTVDDDLVTQARMLSLPLLTTKDVWIEQATDYRFEIHRIRELANWRGKPVVLSVELKRLPFTDPVYSFPVMEMLPAALQLVP